MFVIPIKDRDFTLHSLPFVTMAIAGICIAVFVLSNGRLSRDEEQMSSLHQAVYALYLAHPSLTVPETFLKKQSPDFQEIYGVHREWVNWVITDKTAVLEYLKKLPPPRTRKGPSDMQTLTSLMSPTEPDSGNTASIQFSKADLLDESAKAEFLHQLVSTTETQIQTLQLQLDERVASYESACDNAIANRFGYVPSHPSLLGIVTYVFLHNDWLHLLTNLFLLWLVAPKLEDIWGKRLFAALFFGSAIVGAIFHLAAHSHSTVPVIGASGAISGIMGAFAVRFAKSRLLFFYVYLSLKMRILTGTFEAPAWFTITIWFLGQVLYTVMPSADGVAYWVHIGGFALGVGVAVVFRKTQFEQRVLGISPEMHQSKEDAPLVAFAAAPARSVPAVSLPNAQYPIREMLLEKLDIEGLHCRLQGRVTVLPPDCILALAPGRIDRVSENDARRVFSFGIPAEPAQLLALWVRHTGDMPHGILVLNAANCRWNTVLATPGNSTSSHMIQFTKQLLGLSDKIEYIHGKGPVGAGNLPIYETLDGYLRHLQNQNSRVFNAPPESTALPHHQAD